MLKKTLALLTKSSDVGICPEASTEVTLGIDHKECISNISKGLKL